MISNGKKIKVMVVDDSLIYREAVSSIVSKMQGFEVIGSAANGRIALEKISQLKPDLLTLDIEMPEMNGIEVLKKIREDSINVSSIILSSYTALGGDYTITALELGAFDFILKPDSSVLNDSLEVLQSAIIPKLTTFAKYKEAKDILKWDNIMEQSRTIPSHRLSPDTDDWKSTLSKKHVRSEKIKSKVIAIGLATGGATALASFIPQLPKSLGVPILIVQRDIPSMFIRSLAEKINAQSAIKVMEAVDGLYLQPNIALIAPDEKHMMVEQAFKGDAVVVRIKNDPPEYGCKPSIDYLFRSVSALYGEAATGVILTGMGPDGIKGLMSMKEKGAVTIAQTPSTCVVYGMAKGAIDAGVVDVVAPLDNIAAEIIHTCS
ncbi:MAG: chemotaxis-specific protein-glutamate methyltransferase CheB [Pseudomonadota bacterium]